MRAFVVLCLVAVACADKLGYNYQPVGHSDSGLSFKPGSVGGGSSLGGGFSGGLSGSNGGFSGSNGGLSGSNGGFSGSNGGFGGPVDGGVAAPAELEKEFYTFSAPEGEFDDANAAQRVAGSLKQGLRVIFIKGPENKGLEDAAVALAKNAAQQKTAIYVLNKQADLGDLANKLNNLSSGNNQKPEVHFVKYRTPEDAANAQRGIQSQYDSLGGPSRSVNGGVAPVLNFASQSAPHAPSAQTPQNAYLPSSVFRRV
uniref:DUF243 domain-containing protein n=1 Tax=Musca domestica TaxID=7370 RepID=A0A1I8N6W6_MUSDO